MKTVAHVPAILSLALLAGCAATNSYPPEAAATPPALPNTQWVLIGVLDRKGADELREVPLNKYTLNFDASGTASFKLDCNQGIANWRAMATGPEKGSLSFGPVTATTALCPGESMGEALSSDLKLVSDYSIYDGRLSMFMGEGRVYVWDTID